MNDKKEQNSNRGVVVFLLLSSAVQTNQQAGRQAGK